MARVTVEDCITKVDNHFELVLLAAQRAREVLSGGKPTIDKEDDKNPVLALREIAAETILASDLRDHLIKGMQRYADQETMNEDEFDDIPDDEVLDQFLAETKHIQPVALEDDGDD